MKNRDEIARMLADRALDVAKYLLPNGVHDKREWTVGSIHGEAGKSLKVCLEGNKQGVWRDFATGEGGDLISLWCEVRHSGNFAEAMKEIRKYLGIEEVAFHKPLKEKTFSRPDKPKNPKAIKEGSPVFDYLTKKRKLTIGTIKDFNLGECEDVGPKPDWKSDRPWKGPWIILPFRKGDEVFNIKYLHIGLDNNGKKQTFVEKNCKPTLFGWKTIKSTDDNVCITEGEIDAMSIHQYGHPALSVPFGGGKGEKQQWIEYEWENLEQFKTIYLCMDNDEEGELATTELVERIGRHRCKIVKLPHKDANECLKNGVTKEEIDRCFDEAKSLDPVELKRSSRFNERIEEKFYPSSGIQPGVWSPFVKLKHKLKFRPGEASVWTGINGHGKSTLLGQFMMHFAYQGERICIASLEMKPEATLARIIRQLTNECTPSRENLKKATTWIDEYFWLFDFVGVVDTEKVLEVFEYAYHRYGITQFVIDSFMRCGIDEDDKKEQLNFMNKIIAFVNQFKVHIHLVAHPRKGLNEDHPPGKLDVKGSGCITDLPWNTFTVWRNKIKERVKNGEDTRNRSDTEKILEMPDGLFICDKQREGDWEGRLGLYFDPASQRYYDSDNYRAPKYLEGFNAEQESLFNDSKEDIINDKIDDWNE